MGETACEQRGRRADVLDNARYRACIGAVLAGLGVFRPSTSFAPISGLNRQQSLSRDGTEGQ